MKNCLALLLLLMWFLIHPIGAFAADVRREWTPIPDARFYEYEVSRDAGFSAQGLVHQGRVNESRMQVSLSAGRYYLRVRSIDQKGDPGNWSAAENFLVAGSPILFRNPTEGENIEIPRPTTPIRFEWKSVAGADDYELRLKPLSGKSKTFITQVPSISADDLGVGLWQAEVMARKKGEVISTSALLNFKVQINALPAPRILEPREEEVLPDNESIRVRWFRYTPGNRSILSLRKLGPESKVIWREIVGGSGVVSADLPPIPSGHYQITVEDSFEDGSDGQKSAVTVTLDPMGRLDRSFGGNLHLLYFTQFGENSWQNEASYSGILKTDEGSYSLLELGASYELKNAWGLEARFGSLSAEPRKTVNNQDGSTFEDHVNGEYGERILHFGPTYEWLGWGPALPVIFKSLVGWSSRAFPRFVSAQTFEQSNGNSFRATRFNLIDLQLEAEITLGKPRQPWTLVSRMSTKLPLWAWGARTASRMPKFYPSFQLDALVRRKLFQDIRLSIGGTVQYENINVGSKENQNDRSIRKIRNWGPVVGFDLSF